MNVGGLRLQGEYDINRRHRQFPNPNPDIRPRDHKLATDRSDAYFLIAEYHRFPWQAYGEIYSIHDRYSTRTILVEARGEVFFDDEVRGVFEFVEDNDDQDRFPDWRRRSQNQTASNDLDLGRGIFSGLDENNDFVSDFNQNRNFQPDYVEPFLRHTVDPPEFLFGTDMNNNTVIDRGQHAVAQVVDSRPVPFATVEAQAANGLYRDRASWWDPSPSTKGIPSSGSTRAGGSRCRGAKNSDCGPN